MGLADCWPLVYVWLDSVPEVVCTSKGVGICGSTGGVGWVVCRCVFTAVVCISLSGRNGIYGVTMAAGANAFELKEKTCHLCCWRVRGIDNVPGKFQLNLVLYYCCNYDQCKSPVVNEHPEVDEKCKKAWCGDRGMRARGACWRNP